MVLLPSGQACLRPRCYGGCLLVSHQVPGCRRPQPRAGQNSGRFHCPFCQTYPEPAPHPGSQHLLGPGAFSPSPPTPHLPAAPTVPRHPTSRTEPASLAPACPAAQRTPHLSHRQEVPKPAFPGGNRQTSPDQHLARPAAALPGPPGPFPRPSHSDPRLSLGNLRAVFQRSVRHKSS